MKDIKEGVELAEYILTYSDVHTRWNDFVTKKLAETVILMKDKIHELQNEIISLKDADPWLRENS